MIRRMTDFATAVCVVMLAIASARAADTGGQDRLTIPDVGSIGTPGKGWEWKAVKEYDPQKGGIYVCGAEGKPGKVILTIDPRKIQDDKARIATLKAHFNAMHEELQKLGCTDIKGKRPDLTPPIPEDVDYMVFGTTPRGASVYFAGHTVFKDHTFLVQAAAPSLAQTQKLAEVAGTLKNP
jgi:hypothetical protein